MLRNSLLFILTLYQVSTFAQNVRTGAVIFLAEKDVKIYLDSTRINPSKNFIPLKEGTYKISAWAPTYNLLKDSFTVLKGKTKFYTPHLSRTDEFKKYRLKKFLRASAIIVPASLSALVGAHYFQKYNLMEKDIQQARQDALYSKNEYEQSFSPQEFEQYKNDYNYRVANYNDLIKTQNSISKKGKIVVSSIAGVAVSAIIWNCVSKKPRYNENPLLVSIYPSSDILNSQICMVLKF